MPKQIIIEYPWKAVLNRNYYEIYHYLDFNKRFSVFDDDVYSFDTVGNSSIAQISDINPEILKLITQCQTELNNQ
jgi:hypothetical protein